MSRSGGAIEAKVALPALIMGPAIIIVPALFTVLKAYGVLDPTPEQVGALAALGAALQYVAHVYLGYRAPHTERLDLAPGEVDYAAVNNGGPDPQPAGRHYEPVHLDEGDHR